MAAGAKVILVVDDDPDFLEFIRIVLESTAYHVVTAVTVENGLEVMRQQRPDLVIVDVMISYILDGLSLVREMQEDAALQDIPLIMISAIMNAEDLGELPSSPSADAFMTKPVDPAELLREVRRLIEQASDCPGPSHESKEERCPQK